MDMYFETKLRVFFLQNPRQPRKSKLFGLLPFCNTIMKSKKRKKTATFFRLKSRLKQSKRNSSAVVEESLLFLYNHLTDRDW
jgi:hypothetical protein